jgi:hypothetical protein
MGSIPPDAVDNATIRLVTQRPPGSPFALLDRRVVVTDPPQLVALLGSGNAALLDELVELLDDADRGWAAEVALAALTRREADVVDAFAAAPGAWPASNLGRTARERWRTWLRGAKDRLRWDPQAQAFSEAG